MLMRITLIGAIALALCLPTAALAGSSCCPKKTSCETTTAPAVEQAEAWDRHVDITYSFGLPDLPEGHDEVVAWVPIPPTNDKQRLVNVNVDGGLAYDTVIDSEYGNSLIRLDLTDAISAGSRVTMTLQVSTRSDRPRGDSGGAVSDTELARYLRSDRLVPIDGKIAEEAQRVTSGAAGPFAQAKHLFDNIVESVSYDKTGTGWGRGDALYACDVRAGNCTDFHSLFVGEARALGIPARFVMGLPLPPAGRDGKIDGYHCWAEFYVEGHGWTPVDASEASKRPRQRDQFFGRLDADRVAFTVGRDIRIPDASAPPLNYLIYPHVEVDGEVIADGIDVSLSIEALDT